MSLPGGPIFDIALSQGPDTIAPGPMIANSEGLHSDVG